MFPGNKYGRTLHFGIREHAMGAILNGIALHGGTRAYGGTFLTFSDYMRGAVRLAALMQLPVTYVWTHDSIGLGEDGPTHQPIEHLWALRAIPHLAVVRPGDANETAAAWKHILEHPTNPSALALSRQNLPVAATGPTAWPRRTGRPTAATSWPRPTATREVILIATGSEVQIALAAREQLQASGNADPGGLDALRGVVRGAGLGLPRAGAAAPDQGPGLGRGRRHVRLAAVRR